MRGDRSRASAPTSLRGSRAHRMAEPPRPARPGRSSIDGPPDRDVPSRLPRTRRHVTVIPLSTWRRVPVLLAILALCLAAFAPAALAAKPTHIPPKPVEIQILGL